MERLLIILAASFGFLGVALGAFGAHGLTRFLDGLEDGALQLEWWKTAAHYHLVHSMAILGSALLIPRVSGAAPIVAGFLFVAGILIFSGSLYTMTLTGVRVLGAITPIGGLSFLAGWATLIVAAFRLN